MVFKKTICAVCVASVMCLCRVSSFASGATHSLPSYFKSYETGHINLGAQYSTLSDYYTSADWFQKIGNRYAFDVFGEYGNNQRRLNITTSALISSQQAIKGSIEILTQVLPFDFQAGHTEKRISQYAAGLTYMVDWQEPSWIGQVSLNGYYAKAQDKDLDAYYVIQDGILTTYKRHITGATSYGAVITRTWQPKESVNINTGLTYDVVHFNPKYELIDAHNATSFGAIISMDTLLTRRHKLSMTAEHRVTYDNVVAMLSWHVPVNFNGYVPELQLSREYIYSRNALTNNTITRIGLEMKFLEHSQYDFSLSAPSALSFNEFSSKPAVKMKQVVAAADEEVTSYACLPVIDSYFPTSGHTSESTLLTILGTCLDGVTEVSMASSSTAFYGEVETLAFTIVNQSELKVTIPPTSEGEIVLILVSLGGEVTLDDDFIVIDDTPTISAVTPSSGAQSGGTSVTIGGTQFHDTSNVTIDGVSVNFTEVSDTEITFNTPAHPPGAVDIVVTTPGGSVTAASSYTYNYEAPTITEASPSSGTILGGTEVTITGTNYYDVSEFRFDNASIDFTVNSATSITFTTPLHLGLGYVDITVTTPGGSVTSSNSFSYTAVPDARVFMLRTDNDQPLNVP